MNNILRVENISAMYGKKKILNNLSMQFESEKITAIIGPNGAGKSTLLKVISGILPLMEYGKIFFNGNDITNWTVTKRASNGFGYVMQGGSVFSSLTVKENLELAVKNLNADIIPQGTEEIMDLFPALEKHYTRRAGLLSGGEKQLLAIAMQLIRKPQILLMDEPTGGLSPFMVEMIFDLIRQIKVTLKTSIILVEQNIEEALKNSDGVFALVGGKIFDYSSSPSEWLKNDKLDEIFIGAKRSENIETNSPKTETAMDNLTKPRVLETTISIV